MKSRELAVVGAWEFEPQVFRDDRGLFVSPYERGAFVEAVGKPPFPVAQSSFTRSRRDVVRGVHFTATPPGMQTFVFCAHGEALDIIVDLRVGSPTFGRWDTVMLEPQAFRGVYLPVGVGHAYVALRDNTVMSYLLSTDYVAENELAISITDPELALPIPADVKPILSERDRVAPTLAECRERGLLPDFARCKDLEAAAAKA